MKVRRFFYCRAGTPALLEDLLIPARSRRIPLVENTLRITEIFLSIQGESTHAGRVCAFVRLTGCPMRCTWCDSEYTFTGGEKKTFEEIIAQLESYHCDLVEVTGGEPLAQKNVFPFITLLLDKGYEVLVETGGFISTENADERAQIILDVKCPASGEAERNYWQNLSRLRAGKDEIKFVIEDRADWDFAVEITKKYDLENRAKAILISPVFGKTDLKEMAGWITESGLKARMNLQLHKFIWGPDVHGV